MIAVKFNENGAQIEVGTYEKLPEGFYKAPNDFDWNKRYFLTGGKVKALTQKQVDEEELQRRKNMKAYSVKEEARQAIIKKYPEWKQLNLNAEALKAQAEGKPVPDNVQEAWDEIAGIRTKSDAIEKAVANAKDKDALTAVEITFV